MLYDVRYAGGGKGRYARVGREGVICYYLIAGCIHVLINCSVQYVNFGLMINNFGPVWSRQNIIGLIWGRVHHFFFFGPVWVGVKDDGGN